jgi:hypothetical protein
MLNKYNQLVKMIRDLNKYNVNSFCDLGTEYTTYIDKGIEKSVSISIGEDEDKIALTLTLYFDEDGIYEDVETKYYKNIKSAYNYIVKMLEG